MGVGEMEGGEGSSEAGERGAEEGEGGLWGRVNQFFKLHYPRVVNCLFFHCETHAVHHGRCT